MACTYKDTIIVDGVATQYTIAGESWDEVRQKVLLHPDLVKNYSNLKFYNADNITKIESAVKFLNNRYQEVEGKRGTRRVTSTIDTILNNLFTGSELSEAQKFLYNFQVNEDRLYKEPGDPKGFGTKFHEYMESDGSEEKLEEIIKYVLHYQKLFNELPEDVKNLIKNNLNYTGFYDFITKVTSDKLRNSIIECRLKILNHYKNFKKPITEIAIAAKSDSNTWNTGHIDALYYNELGKMIICDYKTCVSDLPSSIRSKKHLGLLLAYKNILCTTGLNPDDIEIENVKFLFSVDGLMLNEKTGFVNPAYELTMTEELKVRHKIDASFPTIGNNFDDDTKLQTHLEIEQVYKDLFDDKILQRKEEKYIQEELEELSKDPNKTFYSVEYDDHFKVIKNADGTFTLIGKEAGSLKNVTAKEISIKEQSAYKSQTKRSAKLIISAIKSGKEDSITRLIKGKSAENGERLYKNLQRYLNGSWEIYNNSTLEDLGIITFRNMNGSFDFVIISPFHSHMEYPINSGDDTILSALEINNPNLPKRTIGNAIKMKALIAIGTWMKKASNLPVDFRIGKIMSVSLKSGKSISDFNNGFIDAFKILQNKGKYTDLCSKILKCKFASNLDLLVRELQDSVQDKGLISSLNSFTNFSEQNISEKIRRIEEVRKKIKLNYGNSDWDDPSKANQSDEYFQLYSLCGRIILRLNGFKDSLPENITKHGVTGADITGAAWLLLKEGEIAYYTEKGRRVTGLFAGTDFANAYNNPSYYVDFVNKQILAYQGEIKTIFVNSINESNNASIKFLQEYKKLHPLAKLHDFLTGAHMDAYEALLETDKNTNLKLTIVKNPFTDSTLQQFEKEYLFQWLWNINRLRLSDAFFPLKFKLLNWEEAKKDKSTVLWFKLLLTTDSKARELPLRPATKLRGRILLCADIVHGQKTGSQIWEKFSSWFAQGLNPNDIAIDKVLDELARIDRFESFNIYQESQESRLKQLEKHSSVNDYELNFNFLLNDLTLKYIKQKFDDRLLPLIRDVILEMQIVQGETGIDLRSQIQSIKDRTKIMVYGTNRIDAEDKQALGAVKTLKTALNITKLGIRPALMAKELTVGSLKSFSTLAAKLFVTPTGKKLSLKDGLDAAKVVVPDGLITGVVGAALNHHDLGQFTFVEALNNALQITDKDMNSIVETTSADRHGLTAVGERALFYFSVRPDFYHRNTLLVACLKADGCFDALEYDQKTGVLKYNMSKDLRFSEFWKYRNASNYKPTEEFQYQKALYIEMMKEFISINPKDENGNTLHYGEVNDENGRPIYSPLPQVYTRSQITTIKEQIGSMFGMYDHEERSNFENGTWWSMFTSMLTYLPGEMHRWFMKKGQNSIGFLQKCKDVDGNVLYWKNNKQLEMTTEKLDENGIPRLPVLQYKGDQVEGLLVSTLKVLGKACTLDFKNISEYELRNTASALFNILWGTLIVKLLISLIRGDRKDSEIDRGSSLAIDLLTRTGNDLDFYKSVISPIDDMHIVGVDFVKDFAGDIIRVLGDGDSEKISLIYNNISTVKDLHFNIED